MGRYLEQSFSSEYGVIARARAADEDFDELCEDYEQIAELLHKHEKAQSQKQKHLAECLDDLRHEINMWLEKLK